MFGRIPRTLLRQQPSLRNLTQAAPRRAISTAPPSQKSRSWKSSAARWGVAIGGVYWYNTSNAFAEGPQAVGIRLPETEDENELLPTIEEIAARRKQEREAARARRASSNDSPATSGGLQISTPEPAASTASADASPAQAAIAAPDDLEEEAESQGAFNEETGEINWDCPCLGGMAHGPCGPEFREAFSCFVYSKEEPKGVDCIERFKGMQECFRKHPDVYGAELSDDADDDEEEEPHSQAPPATASSSQSATSAAHVTGGEKLAYTRPEDPTDDKKAAQKSKRAKAAATQVAEDHEPTSESEQLVPRAAFSAVDQPVDHQNKQDPSKGGW